MTDLVQVPRRAREAVRGPVYATGHRGRGARLPGAADAGFEVRDVSRRDLVAVFDSLRARKRADRSQAVLVGVRFTDS